MRSDRNAVERVNGFREWIEVRIKGQPEVLAGLDRYYGRSELDLVDTDFVRGVFLFVGPTGTGKTETTLLSGDYWGLKVCRLNMSEFKRAESVETLLRRLQKARAEGARSYLFDEIEKAHFEIMDVLLSILDRGAEVKAPDGTSLVFSDSYVTLTSNLGAKQAMQSQTLNYVSYSETIMEYVRRGLRPELFGRIERCGKVLVFRKLGEVEQRDLVRYHLGVKLAKLAAAGHALTVADDALEFIVRNGFNEIYGARPLIGFMVDQVESAIASAIRSGSSTGGLLVEARDGSGLEIKPMAALLAGAA